MAPNSFLTTLTMWYYVMFHKTYNIKLIFNNKARILIFNNETICI